MFVDDEKKDKIVWCLIKYFYYRFMLYYLGLVG